MQDDLWYSWKFPLSLGENLHRRKDLTVNYDLDNICFVTYCKTRSVATCLDI